MRWKLLHPKATPDMLGLIPAFLDENDPRPAWMQFNANYISGWHPIPRFTFNPETVTLKYPGDPPTQAIAETTLRNERIILFQHAWVMILQQDGTYEVCRMD